MKKILSFILLLISMVGLASCGDKVTVSSIALDGSTEYTYESKEAFEADLSNLSITVLYSDETSKNVSLEASMISAADLALLAVPGTYEITINYEGCTAKCEITIVDNRYSVAVVYPDGTPVSSGVSVQWCTGNICLLPVFVNSNGVAYNACDDANYYIHIEGIPAGYTYDPNAYTANADNKNITIKLISLGNLSGEGSISSPYVASTSAYVVRHTAIGASDIKYYAFTAVEAGSYTVRSICQDELALNTVDPYIGFMGTELNPANANIDGNTDAMNFSHTFTAEANTTYYFMIMITSATKAEEADCTFVIEKN